MPNKLKTLFLSLRLMNDVILFEEKNEKYAYYYFYICQILYSLL